MWHAFGKPLTKLAITAAVVGLVTVAVRMRSASPSCLVRSRAAAISASMSPHAARWPFLIGYCSRKLSYNPRIEACPTAHVDPPDNGCSGLPSTLIGRPSRLVISSPQRASQAPHVVAYETARPGTIPSGCFTYG